MNINNETKLNEEWLAFIRGDVVINANKKWRLHAKLVRAAILNIMAEEERHLNTSYDRDLLKFKNALIEKGILKNEKESINNRFLKSKLKFCDVILKDFLAILVVLDFKSSNLLENEDLLEIVFPVKLSSADLLLILKFSNGDLVLELKLSNTDLLLEVKLFNGVVNNLSDLLLLSK